MKTIGIADFEKLVMERLANPRSFAGKSLLLWNEQYVANGSISYKVINDCCIKHNIANPDKQVWHAYSDFCFYSDNITEIKELCEQENMYGFKTSGILYNTGCFLKDEIELKRWLEFINTHVNQTGHLSEDWSLIACAQASSYDLTEDLFEENCDIYELKPTVDEWARWVSPSCNQHVLRTVLAYIDKNGQTLDFFWWKIIMNDVTHLLKEYECETIDQIPEKEYNWEMRMHPYIPKEKGRDITNFLRTNCQRV